MYYRLLLYSAVHLHVGSVLTRPLCCRAIIWLAQSCFLSQVLTGTVSHFIIRVVNNSNYGWRALRLLARRSPHFFQPTNQQFKSLPEYLENMVIKLAKELPVSTWYLKYFCYFYIFIPSSFPPFSSPSFILFCSLSHCYNTEVTKCIFRTDYSACRFYSPNVVAVIFFQYLCNTSTKTLVSCSL